MASVFTVLTKLEADVGNFTTGMKEAQKSLDGVEKALEKTGSAATSQMGKAEKQTGLLSKAFQALKVSAGAALAAAAAAAVGVVTKGVGRLVQIEEAEAKLIGLGNTTADVATIMDNALSAVRGTAYGMGEAATVASSAVAAGIKPGEQLAGYLKTVADTAYIAGASMEEMGYVLNKTITSGRATNQELQSLAGRGIPIYQMLGETFGTTGDAIFEMASKGEISAEMLQTALNDKIGGAALKSGDTTMGAMKNMEAAFQRVGANIAGPVFDQFQGFFKSVIEEMGPFEERAKEMGVVIGESMEPIMGSLVDIMMPLIELVFELIAPLLDLINTLKPLFDLVKPVVELFSKFVKLVLPPLIYAIGVVAELFAALVAAIIPLIDIYLDQMAKMIDSYVMPALEFLAALLKGTLIPLFNFLADVIGYYILPIISGFASVFEDVLGPAIKEFVDYAQPAIDEFGAFFGRAFEQLADVLMWAWDNVLQPVFGGIMDFFRDVLGMDVGFLSKIGDAFVKGFNQAQLAYKMKFPEVDVTGIRDAHDRMNAAGKEAAEKFAGGFMDGMDEGGQKARDAWAELLASFDADVAKQRAKMQLSGMGLSEGLIEQILGDADYEQILDKLLKGGTKVAEALQAAFNKTTAGIEELNRAFVEFTALADAFKAGVADMFDAFKVLPAIEEDLGRFEKQIVSLAESAQKKLAEGIKLGLITASQKTELDALVAEHESAMRAIAKQRDDVEKQLMQTLGLKEFGIQFNKSIKGVMEGIMPLRYATEVIGQFEHAVIGSFQNVLGSVEQAQDVGYLSESLADSIRLSANATELQLRRLARQRDGLAREYQEFVQQLNSARQFRQATTDAAKSFANITTIGKTARTMVKNFGKIVERTERFRDQLSTLNQMGLNKELYKQILDSGLDAGSATAKALLKGGPQAIDEMNSLFSQLDMTSSQLADESTKVMFNGGEDVIQGFIDGILAQDEQLRKQAETIANAFNDSFQETLNKATLDIDNLIDVLEAKRTALEATAVSLADSFNQAFQNALNSAIAQNAPAPAPTKLAYKAERGESLADVAAKFGTTEEALIAANPKFVDSSNPNYKAGYKGGDYLYSNTLVNIPTAATGGLIRGSGTTTSDSILARLSNGEFIMSAAAVGKYGSGFMSGLNSGRVTMPSAKSSGSGAVNYNITVQAGIGDPAQIGKQVVNAIAAYEKTSGKKIL